MTTNKYIIISPVRDEEQYIEHTILSMLSQTIRPLEWIIVNDGSTDKTAEIAEKYANKEKWIRVIQRDDRGFRSAGTGVIEAFYAGFDAIQNDNWDYVVKLDGDLSFEKDYFSNCFLNFSEDNSLGIAGGVISSKVNGELKIEKGPLFHVRGATKIYKRQCWNDIGGLIRAPGWDTLDEIKANMVGWKTRSFEDLFLIQYRPTGTAEGYWKGIVKNGLANYISGYHPLFFFSKCIKRTLQKPLLVGAAGLMWGYLGGHFKRIPKVNDKSLIQYIRKQQIKALFFQPSIWRTM